MKVTISLLMELVKLIFGLQLMEIQHILNLLVIQMAIF